MRLLWIIAVSVMMSAVTAIAQEDKRTINVTGIGTIQSVPDMAIISLAVTHEDREAQEAMAQVSEDMGAMMNQLGALSVDLRDIQTDQLSLHPVWDQRRYDAQQSPRITGFVASNSVSVRVRDLAALGGILDAVIREGANTFSGLRFTLQDPKPQQDAARAAAVADAIDRASQLATAAGVTLGPIRTMSEQGGHHAPMIKEMAAMRSADVPIAAGEVGVQASVSVVFDILP